jgi:murein DD-endopeptidase MepM/ murein hydrolase activator NlpD
MAGDEEDNGWWPDLGSLNPLVMPFDGFRYTRSMEGKGASQVKAGMEWVADQGQNALPIPPYRGFALAVEKGNSNSWYPNNWLPGVFANKDPQTVICYIPFMHAFVPKWKSNAVKDLEESERIKYNKKILDMIGQNGGRFTVYVDSPEMEGIKITPGDELLLDYQDKKKFTGGYVTKVLKNNKANWLPPEWQNPIGSAAPAADPKSSFENGEPSTVGDVLFEGEGAAFLDVPPAEYDNEELDPNIPENYRPFMHPLNGVGTIASGTPLRNTKTGAHGGIDIGPKGTPIYAVADGYVKTSRQLSGKTEKKYVSDHHLRYLKEDTFTETSGENAGRKYVFRDKGMSSQAGWFCEIIHWHEKTEKHANGQGWGANSKEGYGSRYLHMDAPPIVKRGQKVKKGQLLGHVGGTPFFAPHLHFEIVYKGLYADPTPYMYMDINAIAMIECGGLGADRQAEGSEFGLIKKKITFPDGNSRKINFRIGKYITGQQLVWPKDGNVNPNNPKSSRQWYKPIAGDPLSNEQMSYSAQQAENPDPTQNSDGKDTANEKTPGIDDMPSQPRPDEGGSE